MRRDRTARRRVRSELAIAVLLTAVLAVLLTLRRTEPAAGGQMLEWKPGQSGSEMDGGQMLEWKPGRSVRVWYGAESSNDIDGGRLTDPGTKNAADLVRWAEMAWDDQWGYVWGTFGTVLDEGLLRYKLEQFGDAVGDYEDIIRAKWLGRRTVDCAGLIKSYGWYDPDSGGIEYGYGDMPDIGTDDFYAQAAVRGPIDTLPETPGLLLYAPGHVGVYIGDGWGIEAISHAGGVVKTRVADRPWTDWLQCPFIQY